MSQWPDDLVPAGSLDWELKATSWLFDRCPSEFRTYDVFKNHPRALGHVAIRHLEFQLEAIRDSYRNARTGVQLDPAVLTELLAALEHEGVRMAIELEGAQEVVAALMKAQK